MNSIKRIIIFGRPGSGKSTLAYKLRQKLAIPVYHLDKYFFLENWVIRDEEEFKIILKDIIKQDSWIIDGNPFKSLEMRYEKADIAIYMSYPFFICLWRVIKRIFNKNPAIDDRAKNCKEGISLKFLYYIWSFNRKVREIKRELLEKYPNIKLYNITNNTELKLLEDALLNYNVSYSTNTHSHINMTPALVV